MAPSTLELDGIALEIIDDEATSQFDFSFEIDRTLRILDELKVDGKWVGGSYSEDIWVFEDQNTLVGYAITFNFSRLDPFFFQSNLKPDLKTVVKCWIVQPN